MPRLTLSIALPLTLIACNSSSDAQAENAAENSADNDAPKYITNAASEEWPFLAEEIAMFNEPWAMTFMDDGTMLVTEKPGKLYLVSSDGEKSEVAGVPEVDYGGQGGLGDIVLAPDFAESSMVYLSWVESGGDDTRGAVVGRAKLAMPEAGSDSAPRLEDMEIIWKQFPKVTGRGHYSHRLAFCPDGDHLFIGSGERQKFDPSQDMQANLGKIVRLYPDGTVPEDNPFYDQGGVTAQIWSLGHRNILGLAFDAQGRLWNQEMGPRHGDELNLVQRGKNYGYPIVSNGDHYSGEEIPDHDTRPEFEAPATYWVPAISPAGLGFYDGDVFPEWKGSAFIGGLSSEALVRVSFDGTKAEEAERFEMGARIREAEQGPDGHLWVLEDERRGSGGRLLRLSPKS
ncbi:MAG: PQQ-dependent sugar dehydrogenase [Pseudomonadota bacterium]